MQWQDFNGLMLSKMRQAGSATTGESTLMGHFSMKMVGSADSSIGCWCFVSDSTTLAGEFLYDDLIPTRKLEDSIMTLEEKERQSFLSFVNRMLAWLPEDRQTAGELMEHPFLNG